MEVKFQYSCLSCVPINISFRRTGVRARCKRWSRIEYASRCDNKCIFFNVTHTRIIYRWEKNVLDKCLIRTWNDPAGTIFFALRGQSEQQYSHAYSFKYTIYRVCRGRITVYHIFLTRYCRLSERILVYTIDIRAQAWVYITHVYIYKGEVFVWVGQERVKNKTRSNELETIVVSLCSSSNYCR